jgi:hypothetical protein
VKANNIIQFPVDKRKHLPQSIEEIEDEVAFNRMDFIDGMVAVTASHVISAWHESGIEITPDLYKKYAYIVELQRALLYQEIGMEHPFHDALEKGVEAIDGDTDIAADLKKSMEYLGLID